METLFQANQAVIQYDSDREILTLHLVHSVELKEFRVIMNKVIDFIGEKNCSRLILDQRYVDDLNTEVRAWLTSAWFPELNQLGMNNFQLGFVVSKSLYAKMGVDFIINVVKGKFGIQVESFSSMSEALNWMNE